MRILFYDPLTPFTYDSKTPRERALGGTEATIIRIAEGLKDYHHVAVAQHCRSNDYKTQEREVQYLSFQEAKTLNPDVVILLRQYRLLEEVAHTFPQAKLYLWLHNMPSRELYAKAPTLQQYGYDIIAVSQFHQKAIEKRLQGKWLQRLLSFKRPSIKIPVHVLYNPIEDGLQPDATPILANQLLFMSSPQKGLDQTLRLFAKVQAEFPEYELLIANPGYSPMNLSLPSKTHFLGALPHHEVIAELRRAFCVFYPQTARVETFGLVYAEANAVGTPVLAHDAGAAREVLSEENPVVNAHDPQAVLDQLAAWRKCRPSLQGKPEFRLKQVIQTWLTLLTEAKKQSVRPHQSKTDYLTA